MNSEVRISNHSLKATYLSLLGMVLITGFSLVSCFTEKAYVSVNILFATPEGDLYAGTSEGLYRLTEKADFWTEAELKEQDIRTMIEFRSILYVGTDEGVFRSLDRGKSWEQLIVVWGRTVESFAVSEARIYAGISNGGVFISTDEGKTWAFIGGPGGGFRSMMVFGSQIIVGTTDGLFRYDETEKTWTQVTSAYTGALGVSGTILYAQTLGTETGDSILYSKDGGRSWTKGVSLPLEHDWPGFYTLETSGSTLYAGVNGGVCRSDDGGKTWTCKQFKLDDHVMTIAALSPGGSILYAGTAHSGVFRSKNGGKTWSEVNKGLPFRTVSIIEQLNR